MYLNAYCNTLEDYKNAHDENPNQDFNDIIKKLIIYGVKAFNTKPESEYIEWEEAEKDFQFVSIIKSLMATLTPGEFVNLFPVEKEYKGHKYGMKDYFYTRDYLKDLDFDKPIGQDKILDFLWEYQNWEITDFNVEIMECISRLRQLDGEPSLAEEFADTMGLKTYTMNTDDKGREYLFDNETGKTAMVKKPRPKYLKVIK